MGSVSAPRSSAPAPAIDPCQKSLPATHNVATITRSTDRKSTRLNSSHMSISYAVFCLKKKKKNATMPDITYSYDFQLLLYITDGHLAASTLYHTALPIHVAISSTAHLYQSHL